MAFAKLYETEHGQILVKIDVNDDGRPEVRFYAEPKGLGVCSTAVIFKDCDKGWSDAEDLFGRVDEELALALSKPLFDFLLH